MHIRCACCHGSLLPGEERWACPGCATVLHLECASELDRCPVLGCAERPPGALPDGRVSWARFVADATPWLLLGDALSDREAWGGDGLPYADLEDDDPSGSDSRAA